MEIIGGTPDFEIQFNLIITCFNCGTKLKLNKEDIIYNIQGIFRYYEYTCIFCKEGGLIKDELLTLQQRYIIRNSKPKIIEEKQNKIEVLETKQIDSEKSELPKIIEEKKNKKINKFLKWSFT